MFLQRYFSFICTKLKKLAVSRKRRSLPIIENLEITDVGAEGKAIGHANDRVVFVPYVVPGDVVDVQVTRKKKAFFEAKAIHFHEYSKLRTKPICKHFGVCGGCKWQNLPYEEQLKFKQKQVIDHLERIGKIELPEADNILASEKTTYYRNKLEFTFSNRRYLLASEMDDDSEKEMNALGFHVPKLFDKVLDVEECYLQSKLSDEIRIAVKDYAIKNGLTFFDIRNKGGLLRNLIVRTTTTNELMLIFSFYQEEKENREALLNYIDEKFPSITSLMYVINEKANDTITDQNIILYKGKDHIVEEMEGLQFKIGPVSFFQTNSNQAYELYKKTREFAQLTGKEIVYDLYTGTGTIANFVAKEANKVVGIEYVESAIEDAKINSEINKIGNTHFYAGDIKDLLTGSFIEEQGFPDVIITDPPRAGMHQNVVDAIIYARPKRIVYVSCNSATQARDIQLLDDFYKVTKIQPVDMFPHTHHVENIVLLEQR
jgi:23S rRNA (uracil1939-C5)-methyltransferase